MTHAVHLAKFLVSSPVPLALVLPSTHFLSFWTWLWLKISVSGGNDDFPSPSGVKGAISP